jgi:DNA-binding SARP family transcriptional activator
MLRIKLFGPFEVWAPQGGSPARDLGARQRRILQLLALWGPLAKAELAEALWEGKPPATYVATLESQVSVLRRQLDRVPRAADSVILTRPGGYALDHDRVEVDLWHFNGLLAQAGNLPDPDALALLAQAVDLADAPLLAEEPASAWAVAARHYHQARLAQAATWAAECAMRLGRPQQAAALAARATDADPLAEAGWHIRIAALHDSGDPAAALTCYRDCREALGTEPGPATRALMAPIRNGGGGRSTGGTDLGHAAAQVLATARQLAVGGLTDATARDLVAQARHLVSELALADAASLGATAVPARRSQSARRPWHRVRPRRRRLGAAHR